MKKAKKLRNRLLQGMWMLGICGLSFSSCVDQDLVKDLEDIKAARWAPEIAVPLVNSELSMADLIDEANSEYISVDDEQLIHLIYRGSVISIEGEDVIYTRNQSIANVLTFNPSEIFEFNLSDSVVVEREFNLFYDVNYGDIDSMLMKTLDWSAEYSTGLDHEVEVQFSLPSVSKDGVSFTNRALLTGGQSAQVSEDLKGYLFDMTQGPNGTNDLPIKFKVVVRKTGTSILGAGSTINFDMRFDRNKFHKFWGYVGMEDLINDEADTLELNIFDDSDEGEFTIDDPRIKLIYSNSFGIPTKAEFLQFKSFSKQSGYTDITGFPTDLSIPYPTPAQFGETLSDSIVLNKSNSNIGAIINSQPEKIVYQFEASTNPNGREQQNFIMDTSHLSFYLDFDLPLRGTADGFHLEQDEDFDLDLGETVDLDYVVMRLYLENDFPVDLDVQIYYLDDMGAVIDSLFSPRDLLVSSPPVDNDGRTIGFTTSIHDVNYTKARIDAIEKAKQIRIDASISTTKDGQTQPTVSFYEDYGLRVQLGVAAKVLIKTEGE